MDMIPAKVTEEQAEILESWSRAAAAHAERIRAERKDIAAHVDNRKAFGAELSTNSPFVNTTNDIAQALTGCFVDSLND